MSSDKNLTIYGLLLKNEATYGTPVALSNATDGLNLADLPELVMGYAYDGARAMPPGTAGNQVRVAPQGRNMSPTFAVEFKGSGAAYSASVFPFGNTLGAGQALMKAAGFDMAGSFGAGVEKWTGTPTAGPTGFSSCNYEAYTRGEKWVAAGVFADLAIKGDGLGPVIFSFPTQGIQTATPVDSAAPSITYGALGVLPPVDTNITFTLNAVTTLKVRSWDFALGRHLDPRVNLNATLGHAGFVVGRREPKLTVTVESPAIATQDFYTLRNSATAVACSLVVGGTQYNRFKPTFAQGIVTDVQPGADGSAATLVITYVPHCSTPILNDDISFVFD